MTFTNNSEGFSFGEKTYAYFYNLFPYNKDVDQEMCFCELPLSIVFIFKDPLLLG